MNKIVKDKTDNKTKSGNVLTLYADDIYKRENKILAQKDYMSLKKYNNQDSFMSRYEIVDNSKKILQAIALQAKKGRGGLNKFFNRSVEFSDGIQNVFENIARNKYYTYLSGGSPALGTQGAASLVITLRNVGLQTVDLAVLKYVVNNVSRRKFPLTVKESNFLPIWPLGDTRPKSPSSDNYIGSIVYHPSGVWYLAINNNNLERNILGPYYRKTYKDYLEDRDLSGLVKTNDPSLAGGSRRPVDSFIYDYVNIQKGDKNKVIRLDLENYMGKGKVFRQIKYTDFKQVVAGYFKAAYTFISGKSKSIKDMRILDPEDMFDPTGTPVDPRALASLNKNNLKISKIDI